MPNLFYLGIGIWMIGTGWGTPPSVGGMLKIIGGVILCIAAFLAR